MSRGSVILVPTGSPPLVAPDWERAGEVRWLRPRLLARRWELHVDGEVAAVVAARGVFQRVMVAQTALARWEIARDWLGGATVRREGQSAPALRFHRGWFGARVSAADAEFRWRLAGWWLGQGVMSNREGFEFFRVRRRFSRAEARVELTDAGRRLGELEPLLLLAWALMLSSHHRHGG